MNTHYLSQVVYKIGHALETTKNANDRPILNKLLASAGYLLSIIELKKELKYSISIFEKTISDLWIENEGQFNDIYNNWKYFKEEFNKELSGMTVNERISFLGLFDEFDKNISLKNIDGLRHILNQINITEENINQIIIKYS
jgi:hypothetical protein